MKQTPYNLHGKLALVTGATRLRGIGFAVCRALAEAGADIAFTHFAPYDRTMAWGVEDDEPSRIEAELLALGIRCQGFEADLSLREAGPRLLDGVTEAFTRMPSILVNNAAYSTDSSYSTLDADILDAHYAVNIRTTLLLSAEFARRLESASAGWGRIVSMTSGQSLGAMPGELAYAATKGAIDAMTATLAAELGPLGITVNAVNPGPTDTGWMTGELHSSLANHFPLGRVGLPQDAARLVSFLCSEEGGWVTGQVLHSHGGFR